MKIIALVKEVPDTYGDRKINLETGLASRQESDAVIDEICERALEVALSYADTHSDTEVTVVSMSPDGATASIRKALAMGAHSAVHIADKALSGADFGLTAAALAAAVKVEGFDLIVAGNQSTDGAGGIVPAMLAELLDAPHLTALSTLEIQSDSVSGERPVDGGVQRVSAQLPAVVSVTEAFPEGRFPNFKGIVAAKKKPLRVATLADLDVTSDDFTVPRSIMLTIAERPPRAAGVKITDSGDAGQQLAEYLFQNRLS